MGRGKNKFILSNEQDIAHKKLVTSLKNAMRSEGISITELGILADVGFAQLNAFMTKGRPTTSFSLVKIADTMGFEVAFIKRHDGLMLKDNPIAVARLQAQRQKMSDYYAAKNGGKKKVQKVVKVKHKTKEYYLQAQSMKNQIKRQEIDENNFFD